MLTSDGEYPVGMKVWEDTVIELPERAPRTWRDVFTDSILHITNLISAGEALSCFPVSLLTSEEV